MSHAEIFQGLKQASQRHEKEIVIELSSDRFLHFLGVYFLVLLAIVTKVSEVTGRKLSCFPTTSGNDVSASFVKYANTYCWESSDTVVLHEHTTVNNTDGVGSCLKHVDKRESGGMKFLTDPTFIKRFVQWLPYGMLLEAFAFALPSAWWHFRVGARLMGHLKFVKLLLQDIYETLKNIPAGIYKSESYDKNQGTSIRDKLSSEGKSQVKAEEGSAGCSTQTTDKKDSKMQNLNKKEELRRIAKTVSHRMLDRNLFSLLCHENMSSFEHHAYVTSVFQLTRMADAIEHGDSLPLKSALLRHWCNENNFNKNVMVKAYLLNRVIGILTAIVTLCVMMNVTQKLGKSGWNSETFLCDVLGHEEICVLCTIPRKMETIGLFLVNVLISTLYLVTSIVSLWQFLKGASPVFSDFFDSINDKKTAALHAARRTQSKDD